MKSHRKFLILMRESYDELLTLPIIVGFDVIMIFGGSPTGVVVPPIFA